MTGPELNLPPRLAGILATELPRFSQGEMTRRRAAIEQVMSERGVDHLLVYGAQRSGGAVGWLTGWPITTEAACIVTPDRRDTMFIQFHNHVPQAKLLAPEADVVWGGPNTMHSVASELKTRGGTAARVGVMGPLNFSQAKMLEAACGDLVDLGRDYANLRLVKSAEEIDWIRIGAALSDAGMSALQAALRPGATEHELADAVERAYVPHGATTVIHFIGVTSMANPSVCVPRQFTSGRRLQAGDMAMSEISANFWDYSGQVLRSFAIGAKPSPLHRDLHAVADAAFNAIAHILKPGIALADLVAASHMIEDAGFTICDDLVHGFGGGYLPPILGSASRPAGPLPDVTIKSGMMMVVKPNVITKDQKAGVQTGELMLITQTGCESLHTFPRGFIELA
jgi:Xaa-Pro aminopeptidase